MKEYGDGNGGVVVKDRGASNGRIVHAGFVRRQATNHAHLASTILNVRSHMG